MQIQLVDLQKQYLFIKEEMDKAILKVLANTNFIQGSEVQAFENEFGEYLRTVKGKTAYFPVYCASCANGTDALYLALRALGIKKGDEVITVSHTFIATAEVVVQVGATPVFVDIDAGTMLMDMKQVQKAITPKTKAIIAVHLYGQPCDMDQLMQIAKRHRIFVIEDAAQAHGAVWKGQKVGTFGDLACFSFYPGKNLGAYGDAGAVVSKNEELIEFVRCFANHGRKKGEKYHHSICGINSRMDTLQAAVLRVKLKHLDKWNELRNAHATYYLKHLELPAITIQGGAYSVWHLFVIRSARRDELLKQLKEKGIGAGIHYPVPLHLQPAFAHLGYRQGDFPVTEKIAEEILSLPLYPEMAKSELDFIIQTMQEYVYERV